MNIVKNYEKEWIYIVAITPYYRRNKRTGAVIHYVDGKTELLDCRCEWLIEQLAISFHTTVEVARKNAQLALNNGEKRKPPLALRDGFCLIPLKCRDIDNRNHGTMGYVVLQYIKDLELTADGNSRLIFHKGAPPMVVLQRQRSVQRQIRLAEVAQQYYDDEMKQKQKKIEHAYNRLTSDDWVPAVTEADLKRIREEEREQFEKMQQEKLKNGINAPKGYAGNK